MCGCVHVWWQAYTYYDTYHKGSNKEAHLCLEKFVCECKWSVIWFVAHCNRIGSSNGSCSWSGCGRGIGCGRGSGSSRRRRRILLFNIL